MVSAFATGIGGGADELRIIPMGIHWPKIDEDLSIAAMLRGRRAK